MVQVKNKWLYDDIKIYIYIYYLLQICSSFYNHKKGRIYYENFKYVTKNVRTYHYPSLPEKIPFPLLHATNKLIIPRRELRSHDLSGKIFQPRDFIAGNLASANEDEIFSFRGAERTSRILWADSYGRWRARATARIFCKSDL